MSTWISEIVRRGLRPALAVCALSVLPGCMGETGGLGFLTAAPSAGTGQAVPIARNARLGGGAVVIVPQRGYCVDRSSITDASGGGFALIASCESLTGRLGTTQVDPAVITVSVSPPQRGRVQPEAQVLSGVLPDGVAVRQNNGDGLTVVQVEGTGGALPGERGDTRHWRAVMVVNDRLVGLALYGAPGSAVAGAKGERLLIGLAESIRKNSPRMVAKSDLPQAETAQDTATRDRPMQNLFGRLFP